MKGYNSFPPGLCAFPPFTLRALSAQMHLSSQIKNFLYLKVLPVRTQPRLGEDPLSLNIK